MPSEINPETLDYLRVQLEGQVRANVETALFRYYRNLGSAIIAVLGLVGISLGWPALKSAVQDEVRQQVKQPVADAEDSVKKQQVDIDHSLVRTDARLEQAQTDASKMESKLVEINDTIIRAKQDASTLEDNVDSLSGTVKSNVDRLQDLGKKYASYGAVDTLTQQLSVLSNQINSINKALNQLAQAVGKTNAIIDAQGVSEAVAAIQKQAKTFAATSDDDSRTTVYVQFSVSATRQQIVQLTNKLRKDVTLQIPGEERDESAQGKHEIRYFYKEDEPAAKELKAETESALTDLGYRPVSIDPTPLLNFPAKPKHKVIELWLELPKKK
jgi:predicted  nucleic acid-binding Zn-ribbon protein